MLGGFALFFVSCWRLDFWVQVVTMTPVSGASLLALVFTTVIAYTLWFCQVELLGASNVATYLNLVPIFGIGFASVLLDEPVSVWLIAGGVITFVGCRITTSTKPARGCPSVKQR